MKILMLAPSVTRKGGGVAEAVRLLTTGLGAYHDVEVEVFTLEDEHFCEDQRKWDVPRISTFSVVGPRRYGFSPGLLRSVWATDADVVHVHGLWMFHCLAAMVWSFASDRPYVVTPHGMMEGWILARSPRIKTLVSLAYQDRFLRRAAAVHLLTEKERSDIEELLAGTPSYVIPNCVEPRRDPGEKPPWWHPGLAGRTVYLFLGRLHAKKGCAELCDAWDTLCGSDPHFRERSALVFAGWADGLSSLPQRVGELQRHHGNVFLVGPQYGDDKARTLAACSFFVLPSKSEGLPMTVLEAWAAGKPVLMTRECNLPAGFLSGAALEIGQDPEAIRAGLVRAEGLRPEERARMSEAATRLARTRYGVDTVAKEMTELYRSVLSRGIRGRFDELARCRDQ